MAGIESRHHDRLQGQRLDRRQRRAGLADAEVHEAAASSCCRSASRRARKGPNNAQGQPTYVRRQQRSGVSFGRVAKIFVDPAANEAYIADGYLNKRVAVIDADTGKLKRYWGAYGNKPDDTNLGPYKPEAPPAQQFRNPVHCAELSSDGLVYVCDRSEQSAAGVHEGRQVRQGSVLREEQPERRRGVGRRLLEGSAADLHLPRRRSQHEDPRPAARHARGAHELRRWRPPARSVLRRAQHRRRFEGQSLHDGDLRREARAEVRLQGAARRSRRRNRGRCGRDEHANEDNARIAASVAAVAGRSAALGAASWASRTVGQRRSRRRRRPPTANGAPTAATSASTRYSPLDQINAANFNTLEVAWRFKTDNLGPRPEFNFQSTPLMVGGVLYTTAGSRRAVVALDAATGEMKWMHSLDEGKRGEEAPRQLSGRGLAYWSDGRVGANHLRDARLPDGGARRADRRSASPHSARAASSI